MCAYVFIGTCACGYPWRPEEGMGSPGLELYTGSCDQPVVGADFGHLEEQHLLHPEQ